MEASGKKLKNFQPSPVDQRRKPSDPKMQRNPDGSQPFEIPEPESEEKERYVNAYWEAIVREVERFLGKDGIDFFRQILIKCGTVKVIQPGPRQISKYEGQLVRNIMRRTSCRHWRECDYLRYWPNIIEDAISLHDRLIEEEKLKVFKPLRKDRYGLRT